MPEVGLRGGSVGLENAGGAARARLFADGSEITHSSSASVRSASSRSCGTSQFARACRLSLTSCSTASITSGFGSASTASTTAELPRHARSAPARSYPDRLCGRRPNHLRPLRAGNHPRRPRADGLAQLHGRRSRTLLRRLRDRHPARQRGAPIRGALVTRRPRFSIALLSEDGSEPTWRGLKTLLEKLLRRGRRLHPTRRGPPLRFEPPPRPRRQPMAQQDRPVRSRQARPVALPRAKDLGARRLRRLPLRRRQRLDQARRLRRIRAIRP